MAARVQECPVCGGALKSSAPDATRYDCRLCSGEFLLVREDDFAALAVIIASLALLVLLVSGTYASIPRVGLGLACFISFYYGTRS